MNGKGFLIDTCTLIGLQKRTAESMALLSHHRVRLSDCAISQITYMEFVGFYGADDTTVKQLRAIANGFVCLPISQAISDKTISLRITHKIKLPDSIVLATALTHGLTLLTLDDKLEKRYQNEMTNS